MVLNNEGTQLLIGMIIILNFAVMCADANADARGEEREHWVKALASICLTTFALELGLRLFAERWAACFSQLNWVDFGAVLFGILDEATPVGFFGVLRTMRILRLLSIAKQLRVVRGTKALRELKQLLQMVLSCGRTLLWSMLVFALALSVWSLLAVVLIHPLMADLGGQVTSWDGCERCARSFSSVAAANVTFLQTIIAGDSWGLVAVPVMEAHPWTAFVFVGALFTLSFGMIQVVICIAADAMLDRRLDPLMQAWDFQDYELEENTMLTAMFEEIDKEGLGRVTLSQFEAGAQDLPELAFRLSAVGAGPPELQQAFRLLDFDGSGALDPLKFVGGLRRLAAPEPRLAIPVIRQTMLDLARKQEEFEQTVERKLDAVNEALERAYSAGEKALESALSTHELMERVAKAVMSVERMFWARSTVLPDHSKLSARSSASSASRLRGQERILEPKEPGDAVQTLQDTLRSELKSHVEECIDRALEGLLPTALEAAVRNLPSGLRVPRVYGVAVEVQAEQERRPSVPVKLPDPGAIPVQRQFRPPPLVSPSSYSTWSSQV